MRLATLADGRCVRIEDDALVPLPGRLVDHLCRPAARPAGEPVAAGAALGPPIGRPGKVVCVGLNYAGHAAETGAEAPQRPLLFSKASSCVIGPGADIVMPHPDARLDHEAELAVVIGRPARGLHPSDALAVIGGYACFNDVSERTAQKGDGQWFRGKSHDTFGPLGPFVVTPEDIEDPHGLSIRCLVNGEVRQDSTTADMLFGVADIVAYCSQAFTLEPGDVIATGTPAGVALATGRWLAPGDVVTVEISGLGTLSNRVAPPPACGPVTA